MCNCFTYAQGAGTSDSRAVSSPGKTHRSARSCYYWWSRYFSLSAVMCSVSIVKFVWLHYLVVIKRFLVKISPRNGSTVIMANYNKLDKDCSPYTPQSCVVTSSDLTNLACDGQAIDHSPATSNNNNETF